MAKRGKFACFDLSRKPNAAYGPKWRVDDVVETLTTNNGQLYIVALGEGMQKPTVHRWLDQAERARLQGLRPELFEACGIVEKKTMTGNAFSVPCIGVVLHFIMQVLTTAADNAQAAPPAVPAIAVPAVAVPAVARPMSRSRSPVRSLVIIEID